MLEETISIEWENIKKGQLHLIKGNAHSDIEI